LDAGEILMEIRHQAMDKGISDNEKFSERPLVY